jgi:hypothetical protein
LIGFCLRQIKNIGRQLFYFREQVLDGQCTVETITSFAGREFQFVRLADLFLIIETMLAGRPPEAARLYHIKAPLVFDPDVIHGYYYIVNLCRKLQEIY